MSESYILDEFETEHDFILRIKPELGLYPAVKLAKHQALLRSITNAETLDDIKIILKRMLEK